MNNILKYEITYCYKNPTNPEFREVESVATKRKNTNYENLIKSVEAYNSDLDNDLYIYQVTTIHSDDFRMSRCFTHNGKGIPKPTIRVKESQPLKKSVWDDIYCLDNTSIFSSEAEL